LSGWNELIQWKDGAKPCGRSAYLGTSKRTHFRNQNEKIRRIESARDCKTIDFYFKRSNNNECCPSEGDVNGIVDSALSLPSFREQIANALRAISALTEISANQYHEKRLKHVSKYDFIRLMAVERYLSSLKDSPNSWMSSSLKIAAELFRNGNRQWTAKNIRQWANFSIIDDDDIRLACLTFYVELIPTKSLVKPSQTGFVLLSILNLICLIQSWLQNVMPQDGFRNWGFPWNVLRKAPTWMGMNVSGLLIVFVSDCGVAKASIAVITPYEGRTR